PRSASKGSGAGSLAMIAGTWAINCFGLPLTSQPGPQMPLMNRLHRDGGCQLRCEGSPGSAANLGRFLERA
ncbi:MAG: carbohydrate kinase, partial [Cypionkella sp.]